MRKKLLQNTLFAAIAAWSLYGIQAQGAGANMADGSAGSSATQVAMR